MRPTLNCAMGVLAVACAAGVASADVFPGTGFSILDNTTGSGTANVAGMGPITSITLTMTMSHTYAGDLQIWLEGPGGQTCTLLFTDTLGSYDFNGTYTFDDTAATNIGGTGNDGVKYIPGTYSGEMSLSSVFNGTNPNGVWTLRVSDSYSVDQGSVSSWSLNIVPTPGAAAALGLAGLASLRRRR